MRHTVVRFPRNFKTSTCGLQVLILKKEVSWNHKNPKIWMRYQKNYSPMLFAQLINENELKNWKYFIIIYSFFLHLMIQFPLSLIRKPFDIISPTRTTFFGLCKSVQLLSASKSCNFSLFNLNSQSVGELEILKSRFYAARA